MSKIWTAWSSQDDTYLRERYALDGCKACAFSLKRGTTTVHKRAQLLRLTKPLKPSHHTIPARVWIALINNAKTRGLTVEIVIDDIWTQYIKQDGKCALTGWSIRFNTRYQDNTVSVDRINSALPYVRGNVQLVHKDVNFSKIDHNESRFYAICRAVADYRPDLACVSHEA